MSLLNGKSILGYAKYTTNNRAVQQSDRYISSGHHEVTNTEYTYMSFKSFYLTLQFIAPHDQNRQEIIDKVIAATQERIRLHRIL